MEKTTVFTANYLSSLQKLFINIRNFAQLGTKKENNQGPKTEHKHFNEAKSQK